MQRRLISAGTGLQQRLATLRPPRIGNCRPVDPADHPVAGTLPEPGLDYRHLQVTSCFWEKPVREICLSALGYLTSPHPSVGPAHDHAISAGRVTNVASAHFSTKSTDA